MMFSVISISKIIFVLFFLINFNFIKSDLPIHCLKHDVITYLIKIIGTWTVTATALFNVRSNKEMKCGHEMPSREETSNLAMPSLEFR
jgi:hypothetical protein